MGTMNQATRNINERWLRPHPNHGRLCEVCGEGDSTAKGKVGTLWIIGKSGSWKVHYGCREEA